MSVSLAEALKHVDLQPGQTYREKVNGFTVEVRVLDDAATPGRIAPTEEEQKRFHQLARRWRKETAHLSSVTRMAAHPAYREIVAMSWSAVPLLLAELERKPDHRFVALEEITGANPVTEHSEGILEKMAQAWIRWGETGQRMRDQGV